MNDEHLSLMTLVGESMTNYLEVVMEEDPKALLERYGTQQRREVSLYLPDDGVRSIDEREVWLIETSLNLHLCLLGDELYYAVADDTAALELYRSGEEVVHGTHLSVVARDNKLSDADSCEVCRTLIGASAHLLLEYPLSFV